GHSETARLGDSPKKNFPGRAISFRKSVRRHTGMVQRWAGCSDSWTPRIAHVWTVPEFSFSVVKTGGKWRTRRRGGTMAPQDSSQISMTLFPCRGSLHVEAVRCCYPAVPQS